MLELVKAGGWLMVPIIGCSILALAIIGERFWTLQKKRVAPPNLVVQAWQWARSGTLNEDRIRALRSGSPLGRILAAGLVNRQFPREIMKDAIEDVGRHVVHELERYLNMLGTIASIAPLLGLLGTVVGMIQIFSVITAEGMGHGQALAGGLAKALITTAAGLFAGIPSLFFYHYFRGRVDELVMTMEQEALKLVEVLQGHRERNEVSGSTASKRTGT